MNYTFNISNNTIAWIEARMEHIPASKRKRIPKWARMAAISDDGTVYIPGLVASPNLKMVLLCAGNDGISVILDHNHAYYPAQWIAKEFPKSAQIANKIENKVREYQKTMEQK